MQKVTDFLEKNVQWVAIALGGIYLLWMVYSYVFNTAAMDVSVGGQQMAPGKVDDYVLNNVALPLSDKIKSSKPVAIPVPPIHAVDLDAAAPAPLAVNWTDSQTKGPQIPDQNPNNPANPGQAAGTGTLAAANKVMELPKPPAPTELATATGRSSVYIPPQVVNAAFLQAQQAATAAAAQPAGAAAPQPQPEQPQQQVQLQTGPNGQQQLTVNGQPVQGTDIDWVTVSYKIHMQDLANEFTRCYIPPAQQGQGDTCFLDVELLRQEQLPNGQWGNDTVIPKLTTTDQPPMPDEKASRALLQAYLNWAMSNLSTLLHPLFYTYIQGDQWMLPTDLTGMTVVADNGEVKTLGPQDTRPGFDPNQYLTMTQAQLNAVTPKLTEKERQEIQQAKDAKRRQDAQSKARANTPTPRSNSRGGNNFGGAPAVGDEGRPASPRPFSAAGGNQTPEGGPGAGDAGAGGGAPSQPQQPQTQAQLLQTYQQMFPLPAQGDFDPRTMTSNQGNQQGQPMTLVGWAHDATAQPGKTYRYAVRYKIKSPVWGTFNTTKDPKMVNVFALESATSAWTQPVVVPPTVRFYFTSNSSGSSIPVEVYRWQNGVYNKANLRVSPGDPIGKTINNVDYATNFTVVDFRRDGNDNTSVWLLNPDGQMVRRDSKSDANSNDLNQVRKQYEQQQAQLQAQQLQQQQQNGQGGAGGAGVGGAPPLVNPVGGGAQFKAQ